MPLFAYQHMTTIFTTMSLWVYTPPTRCWCRCVCRLTPRPSASVGTQKNRWWRAGQIEREKRKRDSGKVESCENPVDDARKRMPDHSAPPKKLSASIRE